MNANYANGIANAGATMVAYIGLVNDVGSEPSGGGYTRLPVFWLLTQPGRIQPTADLLFDVPPGKYVGWRGHSAASGGTDYDGATFPIAQQRTFAGNGVLRVLAADVFIDHATDS